MTVDEPSAPGLLREAATEWPIPALDVDAERRYGWRPLPLREVVVKLVGPCNLACDYCYVYVGADRSWQHRPAMASERVLQRTAHRIGEHAQRYGLERVRVVLHGGEPLLAGPEHLRRAVATLREGAAPAVRLDVTVQTNGIPLDATMLDVLAGQGVMVGVSIDGGRAQNDRHRVHRDGTGSYDDVRRGLDLLTGPRFRSLFSGLLCTVDPGHDPIAVYEELAQYSPPTIDFLLPHRTWASSGPAPPGSEPTAGGHGAWLTTVFDRWFTTSRGETRVRLFDDVLRLLLGGTARSDQVGLSPAAFVVVDTDGTLQQVDALKVVAPGAPETGLNVFDHALDDVCVHPAIVARQIGLRALGATCRSCRLVRVCGGGHYTHRYRPGSGFRHPSAYCADLQVLIDHVADRLVATGQNAGRDAGQVPGHVGGTSTSDSPRSPPSTATRSGFSAPNA